MGNLRRWLPWTYATFLVGWLAIAGVPPLSGFWAKSDILDNVFSKSKPLWVLGIITAILTAYYMTRIFRLAFTGDDRWKEAAGDHPAHHTPHESPWVMRLPLVILAVAAAVAGVLNLPWVHTFGLSEWLAPVFRGTLYEPNLTVTSQWVLGTVDAVAAVVGIAVAWQLWRARAERPELTPAFLARVWYWDDFYDAALGRPGQALARFCATVVDGRVIDGAVNGSASLVRQSGTGGRRLQTGYVRNYALGIMLGVAGLLAFMLSRAWWS
jgi:NADH-quinone oxidoreductase subunit L